LEYTAHGCEVQRREDWSLSRKESERAQVDAIKVASHVNAAVCYLRIAESSYAHERLTMREKAILECNRALALDGSSMKAVYRRGQAYMAMGDLPKARDDLLSAARRAPDAKEIRADLTKLRELQREETASVRQLGSNRRPAGCP
jgi:tetratricopeptide (TPR) repeat protein